MTPAQPLAGSTLLVTRSSHLDSDVASSVADNGQLALAPDVVLKRSVVQARKGDTVASLAQRFGVTPASVTEWNRLISPGALKKGQSVVLFLPTHGSTRATPASGTRNAAPVTTKGRTSRAVAKPAPRSSSKPSIKASGKPTRKTPR